MIKKIKIFSHEHICELEKQINEFSKSHNIENVSYSVCKSGYTPYHYCCVLYSDKLRK